MKSRFVVIPAVSQNRVSYPRRGTSYSAEPAPPRFDIYDNEEKCRIITLFHSQVEAEMACAEKNRSTPYELQLASKPDNSLSLE
ncbi:hypothetical protein ACMGT0_20435 [Pseudomonas sp. RHF3.3-3]|uniref:hypothetical protein n=1 Tax=Pseudomonas sp. RHF3.3-3 TaxID=3396624 RepID=UPI003A881F9B